MGDKFSIILSTQIAREIVGFFMQFFIENNKHSSISKSEFV